MPYALRLIECLISAGARVYVLTSQAAQVVIRQELPDLAIPAKTDQLAEWLIQQYHGKSDQVKVFGREEWFSPVASGSNPADAMVVCPCSMGTLAAIAHGMSDNLIERAADVMLKEQRPLIIVPREMPFSVIHLENMLTLAKQRVVIMPPSPGFYHHPTTIEEMVDFVVARILDHLSVPHEIIQRWGER
ncbi:flavin prenyltransferase UbiX [Leeia speluncae]